MGYKLCIFYFITVLTAYVTYNLYLLDYSVPEEFKFSTADFIQKYGYDYENHSIETSDGFITTLFRILPPGEEKKDSKKRGHPVLIEGGIFCSSDVMVLTGPERDLGFILVNAGYDVWLGNYRGTRYTVLGPNANKSDPLSIYFGYHEMGIYDFASTIDYILMMSGYKKLSVAAVSVGSSSLLALLSTNPSYNEKIKVALHLGSGIALRMGTFSQKFLFYSILYFPSLFLKSGVLEDYALRPIVTLLLCERTFFSPLCMQFLRDSCGLPEGKNMTLAALTVTLLPSGTPVGVVDHLLQLSTSNTSDFRMRDFGHEENIRKYNLSQPPLYDLTLVTAPSRAYFAQDDQLVQDQVAKNILRKLPNYLGEHSVKSPFCHANFFISSGIDKNFIEDVLRTLPKPSPAFDGAL